MKFEFSTSAYFKDGKLMIRNRQQLESEGLASGLNEFEVVVRKKTKNRSILQNRYYRGCVKIVANYLGYYPERMHQIIGFKFLKKIDVDEKTGETFEFIESTTKLTTTEFATFMNEFIDWAKDDFNIDLPKPNEQLSILPHQQ